ncbi:hypothetical protein JXM67_09825 [candidate division WOR-3 bacterium]|nr:hypothetical protein [candidate division WOR-3 bacterium]
MKANLYVKQSLNLKFILPVILLGSTSIYPQEDRQFLEVFREGLFDYKVEVTDWVPGETFFDLGGYHYLWTGETCIDYSKGYATLEIANQVVGVDLTPEQSGELDKILRKKGEISNKDIATARTVKVDTSYWFKLSQIPKILALEGGLSDRLLKRLKKQTRLRGLWIWGEGITDKGLSYLVDMTNLCELSLAETSITDSGLLHLAGLTRLRRLSITQTPITGEGFRDLSVLYQLEYLDLSGTGISDEGLIRIANLAILTELNLEGTQVTGTGLIHLENLSNLRELNLQNTKVTFGSEATINLKMALPECHILF